MGAATYELISRNYCWPNMRKVIARYLSNCETCTRIKPVRYKPYGQLKPLKIPFVRWNSVSIDFIIRLPESNGYNTILVVVDRLSKMAHYILTNEKVTLEQVARLFFDKVFKHHRIPDSIISDCGTEFTSKFSKALCSLIGINQKLSTSFHSQTDGQIVRTNAILKQYLQRYINYKQNN